MIATPILAIMNTHVVDSTAHAPWDILVTTVSRNHTINNGGRGSTGGGQTSSDGNDPNFIAEDDAN